jgi:hypothetical protein
MQPVKRDGAYVFHIVRNAQLELPGVVVLDGFGHGSRRRYVSAAGGDSGEKKGGSAPFSAHRLTIMTRRGCVGQSILLVSPGGALQALVVESASTWLEELESTRAPRRVKRMPPLSRACGSRPAGQASSKKNGAQTMGTTV